MLPAGFSRKLLFIVVLSNLVVAVCFCVTVPRWYESDANGRVKTHLRATATFLRDYLTHHLESAGLSPADFAQLGPSPELQSLLRKSVGDSPLRLTVIDANGVVLGDSEHDAEHMLNHGNRAELLAAQRFSEGTATRLSPTLGTEFSYFAMSVGGHEDLRGFVRVAIPTEPLRREIRRFRYSLWLLALIITGCCSLISFGVIHVLMSPLRKLTQAVQAIAAGHPNELLALPRQDEVGELADAFREIQEQLTNQLAQLHSKNEQLATVLSSMEEGIIAVDRDELILFANGASQTMLGVVIGDIIGRPLVEASRSRRLQEVVHATLNLQRSGAAEFEFTSQPRRVVSVRVTCLPGEPCPGAVILLHDTTELRRLETLRQEFVANVSHELKTPLSAIKAYAETLRLGAINDPENNQRFVVGIQEQASRLHDLILDMLQIARVEAGKEVFDIASIPLEPTVRSSIAQHTEAAERKQLQLEVECPETPLAVQADLQGLQSIIDNLVDNAVKYTPDGGTVSLRWHRDGSFVHLEIEDTGIGISAEDQRRIFERFFRGDKARTRELGGTGLGLSIVKHLSQAFGGSVELQSELGVGSRFIVKLPLSDSC